MKVIVTGSTGLVGRALVRSLLADGHEVTRLVRGDSQGFRAPGTAAVHWDPERGEIDAKELEGHDAAVHLAGESVAEGRWDPGPVIANIAARRYTLVLVNDVTDESLRVTWGDAIIDALLANYEPQLDGYVPKRP